MSGSQLGMLIALASFGMLFGTFALSLLLARSRSPVWPPIGVEPIQPLLPSIATAVLLISSITLHTAFKKLESGHVAAFRGWWHATTAAGWLFVALQIGTWKQLFSMGVHANSSLLAGIFFAVTGVHALHVIGGLIALHVVGARREPSKHLEGARLTGWFWHFVDVVWVLFYVLLVIV